jgi:long-chain acyl-CoA synthetase
VPTIPDIWERAVAEPAPAPAYLVRERGAWREISWDEAGRRVDELAAGLLALGIRKGDRVAILSRTRLEWALTDFALVSIGAVVVPIYATSSADETLHVLADSGARAVVCENREQLTKVGAVRDRLPALEHVIALEDAGQDGVLPWAEVGESDREAVARARAAIREDDVLTLIYTSGTTGRPKGCVLTHRNMAATVAGVEKIEGLHRPGDVAVLFLPLAHVFARLVHYVAPSTPITIAFVPDVRAVARALEEVRPTVFPSVPRLYEKVHATVRGTFDQATGHRRALVDWALRVGYRASRFRQEGRPYPPALALQFRLADRLVFSKVKARLGGRVRTIVSGGAPLAREVAEFFDALDILILEGYGLTECAVAAVNRPQRYRFGTVGLPFPGIDVRLDEDGEILLKGESVFGGYYGDDDATRAVLDEGGWLRTGDVGALDPHGFLTITDRKKELIVTAAGKNVSPANIENELKVCPYVSQVLVVGDRRPFVIALVTLDEAEVEKLGDPEEARARVAEAVAAVNAKRNPDEQVRRWTILPRDFSEEEGELTPTLKVRRRVVEEHFRDEVERLYAGRV